jgi:hypothetical protein
MTSDDRTQTKRPTIVARLMGGLGNQLFIYAAARALALRNNAVLRFDLVSGFERDFYKQRNQLGHFDARVTPAVRHECMAGLAGRLRRKWNLKRNRNRPAARRDYVTDPIYHFSQEVCSSPVTRNIYLDGFWESWRYFADCEDQIRHNLRMEDPTEPENISLAEEIDACDAICIHGRRLKGVANSPSAKPREVQPQISAQYYERAIASLAADLRNPKVFCFADYADWWQSNLRIDVPAKFVGHNRGDHNSWKDLWLMRRCRRFAIATSTFSWWAAWLSDAADKRVIYPEPTAWKWIRNADMMPPEWEMMEAS